MSNCGTVKYQQGASFLLAKLGRRAEQAWHAHLSGQGITTAQFTALAALAEGDRTQRDLAAAVAVDPRNIGATVKSLVAAGWVESRTSESDGRSRVVSLTPSGRTRWQSLQPGLAQGRTSFFAGISADELAQLESLLRRLDQAHTTSTKVAQQNT